MATQFMYSQGPNYGGPAYDYSGHAGKNGGFAFRKRFERVDWRKIASVDVDQISRTLDFNALQENIINITFCNIETELDMRMVDPNFLKLFRLAQLTIEYLLHSQDYLAGLVASHEEKVKKEKEDHNELQKQLEQLQQELSDVKKESHKRKKLLIAQQQMMHAGSGSYNKCPFCTKAFLNNSFLQSHITRRHGGSVGMSKSSSPTHGGSINQTLEAELQHIKERLRMTESQLQDERKMLESLKNKENKTSSVVTAHMEAYRESEAGDREEIERIKELFMKELQEVNQKYTAAEQALVEMENRSGMKRSNLGDIVDDVEHEKSFLQQQREQVAVLKEELQQQVGTVESRLKVELERQEKKWQKKVHKMTKQHADELRKLNDALEHTSREVGRRATTPEARQQQQQVENLLRRSREQEKLLSSQEEMLKREVDRPIAASPVTHLSVPRSPRPPRPSSPGRMMSMVPSDEDDESTMFGSGSMNNTGRRSLKSTLATTGSLGDPTLGTTQFLEQLRKNPTLKIMHEEFAAMLEEQVANRGIPRGTPGISQQVLDNKLAMMKTQRQSYIKKFTDFETLRLHYDRIAELKAREKVKAMKTSPPMPPRNLHSSLPSSHVGSPVQYRSPAQTPARSPSPRGRSPQPQGRAASPSPPKPAPRSTTPQKTLQSTGSTTEWTSTQWDSDEDEEDEDDMRGRGQPLMVTPSKSNRSNLTQPRGSAPSPRPRGQIIQSKPLKDVDDDDDDDWDDDSNSMLRPKAAVPKPVQPRVIMSQPRGQKVSELSKSIESQLSNRKKGDKPVGGVDTMEKKKISVAVDILEDIDGSDWEVSSVEDEEPAKVQKRPPTRNSNRGSHAETDFSTNTYGTSVWGSSSKGASTANPHNRASTSKSSFISSDDDLELENI